MLRAQARVLSVTAELGGTREDLELALSDYEVLLCGSDQGEKAKTFSFCAGRGKIPGYLWRSPTVWNLMNDALYERALVLTLLGRREDAMTSLKELSSLPAVLKADYKLSEPYSQLSDLSYDRVSRDRNQTDQIYVHQVIPGLGRPLAKNFATKTLADFTQAQLDRHCSQTCWATLSSKNVASRQYLAAVDTIASAIAKAENNDNSVVIGSFDSLFHATQAMTRFEENRDAVENLDRVRKRHARLANLEFRLVRAPNGTYVIRSFPELLDGELYDVLSALRGVPNKTIVRPPAY
jgi:tetratricopeptide (TPR) repeat protein